MGHLHIFVSAYLHIRFKMGIEKIDIARFLELYPRLPVFDVRSPGEYNHARIPGAYSLPLFNDEERKIVGTAYKQESREQAIKIGLDFFGSKMRRLIEEVSAIVQDKKFVKTAPLYPVSETYSKPPVIVHCWRGGMRSAGVAWVLDLYGFKVYTITGGYKSYRKWVLDYFETNHPINILGGYTGSGKTEILHQLKAKGETIVDLEGIANHKGSAFGALGMPPQPSQEMFENQLAIDLFQATSTGNEIWIEDESQRIGHINIPQGFWRIMRAAPVFFVDIPFENRLEFISRAYGKHQKGELAAAITRIQKRLGPLETKTALSFLVENDMAGCFGILLKYYDKLYSKALTNRPETNKQITTIPCINPGTPAAADSVIASKKTSYA
jgi:tRNA 2-selenouridine synthase